MKKIWLKIVLGYYKFCLAEVLYSSDDGENRNVRFYRMKVYIINKRMEEL